MLDLQIWSERRMYFSGSYFQNGLEYLFPLILQRGGLVAGHRREHRADLVDGEFVD
jgi:hypothetical protein